jgi:hypothetical protein
MPTYTVACDRCGACLDVVCTIAERNVPKPCKDWVTDTDRTKAQAEQAKLAESGAVAASTVPLARCDGLGTLQRGDELETFAHTPYNWRS